MEDYSKELLRTGIIEAKAGNLDTARRYLDRAIYMAGSHDVISEAWFWMSEVLDNAVEKRKALENCLALDMQHARARRVKVTVRQEQQRLRLTIQDDGALLLFMYGVANWFYGAFAAAGGALRRLPQVVVVVVELGIRIGGVCELERLGDEVVADAQLDAARRGDVPVGDGAQHVLLEEDAARSQQVEILVEILGYVRERQVGEPPVVGIQTDELHQILPTVRERGETMHHALGHAGRARDGARDPGLRRRGAGHFTRGLSFQSAHLYSVFSNL